MEYPTAQEVEAADREQLGRWYRFLNSPGWSAADLNDQTKFEMVMAQEKTILDIIIMRFEKMGGFNPVISKHIGWEEV